MKHLRMILSALLFALVAASLFAHDFWIEPTTYRPQLGKLIGFRLCVGHTPNPEEISRQARLVNKFFVVGPDDKETPAPGKEGGVPAGIAVFTKPGLYVVGYRSNNTPIEIKPGLFERYLHEEGLEAISDIRYNAGDTEKPGREAFSRCAKSLLLVDGGGSGEGFDRVLGFDLEIVPEKNPYALLTGDRFPFRVLFHGQPIKGILVGALDQEGPEKEILARTDENGRVNLTLPRGGRWIVHAVHMFPAPPELGVDWQSLWASVTFDIHSGGK